MMNYTARVNFKMCHPHKEEYLFCTDFEKELAKHSFYMEISVFSDFEGFASPDIQLTEEGVKCLISLFKRDEISKEEFSRIIDAATMIEPNNLYRIRLMLFLLTVDLTSLTWNGKEIPVNNDLSDTFKASSLLSLFTDQDTNFELFTDWEEYDEDEDEDWEEDDEESEEGDEPDDEDDEKNYRKIRRR